jgi:hypothetical protein
MKGASMHARIDILVVYNEPETLERMFSWSPLVSFPVKSTLHR